MRVHAHACEYVCINPGVGRTRFGKEVSAASGVYVTPGCKAVTPVFAQFRNAAANQLDSSIHRSWPRMGGCMSRSFTSRIGTRCVNPNHNRTSKHLRVLNPDPRQRGVVARVPGKFPPTRGCTFDPITDINPDLKARSLTAQVLAGLTRGRGKNAETNVEHGFE